MQVVIEIDEHSYNLICRFITCEGYNVLPTSITNRLFKEVVRGTPLPKGHGRLIDADETIANLQKQCDEVFKLGKVKPEDYYIAKDAKFMQDTWRTWCVDFNKWLTNRPVVIPADKDGD